MRSESLLNSHRPTEYPSPSTGACADSMVNIGRQPLRHRYVVALSPTPVTVACASDCLSPHRAHVVSMWSSRSDSPKMTWGKTSEASGIGTLLNS